MKYGWTINQAGLMSAGLQGKIDVIDYSIFKLFYTSFGSKKMITMQDKGVFYMMFSWKLVKEQMPFLGLSSRSAISKRIKKIASVGLIEAHENNQKLGAAWYAVGDLAEVVENYKVNGSEKNKVSVKQHTPVRQTTHPCPSNNTPPVRNNGHNKVITNTVINNTSIKKREKTAQKKSTETKTETPPHSDYDFYYQQEVKKREDAGKKEKVAPKRKKYIVPMMAAVYGKRFECEFGEPYEANDSHKNAFRKIAEKIKSRLCKQGKPHDTQAITDFFSGMVAKMDSKFVQSKNFYPKFINSDFPNLVVSLGRKPKNTNRISDWYEGIGENKEDLPW